MKISTITDPAHVSNVMSILLFTNATLPLMSSRITRSHVNVTDIIDTLTFHMSFLNILVELTNFICIESSSSRIDLVPTLQISIYDCEPYCFSPKLLFTRCLSSIKFAKLSEHQFMTLRRCAWRFLSNVECFIVFSKGILISFHCFSISTRPNNAVAGYFKCRLLPYRTLK